MLHTPLCDRLGPGAPFGPWDGLELAAEAIVRRTEAEAEAAPGAAVPA